MVVVAMLRLLAFFAVAVVSQQLEGPPMGMPYNVSAHCFQALNTTSVSCPGALADLAQSGGTIDDEGVTYLCNPSCITSLESARSIIAGACQSTDVIVINDVAYPATFFADNYIYTYNLACRQDSSGQYCDPLLAAWASQRSLNSTQSCSDCWLGAQALQLGNPLGYDAGLASNFASLTSSCNATQYSYTTPTAYALNATTATAPVSASASATPPPSCTGSYTVQATDTCYSVSQVLNVSTYSLLVSNNLDIYCENFNASVGSNLCSPPTCELYTWQASDTCASVALANPPITLPQFQAWNPSFNDLCGNTGNFVGYQVCLSPPGGALNHTASTGTAATAAVPAPTNAMTGSNRDCGDWYTIIEGDTCGLVTVANFLSLSDFYFLNPEINANCTNLDLGIAYCVEPVGNIQTYPGYTMTSGAPSITVPPVTFTSINTDITTPTPVAGYNYMPSYLPTAPGTLSGCFDYVNYNSSLTNDCTDVAADYQITTAELLSRNPSLSSNLSTCSLQPGYSYCVLLTNATETSTLDLCTPINATDIVTGTSSTCDCFIDLQGYLSGEYGCKDIESDYSITASQLTTWNTWLGSSTCDTDLYNNLAYNDSRPVCVGVNASEPIGSVGSGPSATPSPTTITTGTITTTVSMGPTASGEVTGCLQYYTVQSGDTCYNIETTYGISFSQFYAWNPSIGSSCGNLWLGYAYCVKGPASSSTTTAGASAPTQSGIASNCDEYHTVVSGDSCAAIETQYNDTFTELYQWNPAIGSSCQNLWVGYAICVGVS